MIILGSLLIGVGLGIRTARKRNGNRLDMAQYGAGYGIAFMLLGGLITIIIERSVT